MATSSKGKRRKTTSKRAGKRVYAKQAKTDAALFDEIGIIVLFVCMVILFLCNFGLIGVVGNTISSVMFGIFGLTAYIVPILIFLAVTFMTANCGNITATRKLIAGIVLFLMVGIICDLFGGVAPALSKYDPAEIYKWSADFKYGGGFIAGSLSYLLNKYFSFVGTVLIVVLLSAISLILITEKSIISNVKKSSEYIREKTEKDAAYYREYQNARAELREEKNRKRSEERRLRAEEKENEKILRMEKKVSGVTLDTSIVDESVKPKDLDMHEINVVEDEPENDFGFAEDIIEKSIPESVSNSEISSDPYVEEYEYFDEEILPPSGQSEKTDDPKKPEPQTVEAMPARDGFEEHASHYYKFPPLNLLKKGEKKAAGYNQDDSQATGEKLCEVLDTFGVHVRLLGISKGPTVTQYELQPDVGVKVSKIMSLIDDLKLNLAATDIRIEAPIPGKAAIGVEIPNKSNSAVVFRDLIESNEYKASKSNLTFAVGKDIAGKTIVADIAKMPHVLIAGSTGSGKSVCINTLIMSILYKASPDDVKLIMVDPKVVELSVYNGIPHLLIPVVTDPKKANVALKWAVSEMDRRYKELAEINVRDIKSYNEKVEELKAQGLDAPEKMPQILVIIDELADLMMVCANEVEESICRIAQLARAAGIHLVVATQRPSADIITGLIKANMPSRIAFAVSSGIDSRVILDVVGAERLLGKGDMLFYPQGYTKPLRVQGAFVSDDEINNVVEFLKDQSYGYTEHGQTVAEIINSQAEAEAGMSENSDTIANDPLFLDAGKTIIQSDKASIGMLQRKFKIGFNRAARIMDQLCEAGVVGEEEGTKPRKILMSMDEFNERF